MNSQDSIKIIGATENNLKNIKVSFPKNKLVTVCGPSGSGKSTLLYDVLYKEAHRLYTQSLSLHSSSSHQQIERPKVEKIEGLTPTIAVGSVQQKFNRRSTLASTTDILFFLRILFEQLAISNCPNCNKNISARKEDEIINEILCYPEQSKLVFSAPLVTRRKGNFQGLLKEVHQQGFVRFSIDNDIFLYEDIPPLDEKKYHNIEVVVDRIKLKKEQKSRISEAIHTCLKISQGQLILAINGEIKYFNTHFYCSTCNQSYPNPDFHLYSNNHPKGACSHCRGIGEMTKFEARKFFDFDKSINQGGILYFNNIKGKYIYQWMSHLSQLANIDMDIPIGHLTQKQLDMISWGKKINDKYPDKMHEGIIIQAQRRMRESTSSLVHEQLEKYMIKGTCQYCSGSGYCSWALSQRIDDKNILDYLVMDIKELYQIAKEKVFTGKKLEKKMWSEIKSRCQYLIDSGLHYLTPHRQMNTLSGGEYNRIRFAVQLSAALSGITYVLDEPGLGLHPADYKSLIKNIRRLLEKNNHVLLIEHREDILEQSDYIVECGPGAGNLGGQVLYQGQLSPQAKRIWQYLYSKKQLSESKKVKSTLHLGPFDTNNLQQIHIDIHTKSLNILCGVSGSGKSTLFRELKNNYQIKKILNKTFSQIYHMDQKAMGKSIRSNPATITGVFEFIRQFYAQLPESRIKGYKPNHFSFNSKEGQCDQCRGIGEQKIDMHFMPDIYVPCDICNGQRYLAEILQIEYKGFNINQILEMSFAEANKFFAHLAQIKHRMQAMVDVGLEYLKLGQRSHYLSGGEWQRLKLACELGKSQTEPVLYLLDEPTSGLFFSDIEQLLKVFDSLIERGHTLLLIEHNPNLLARADHLIEMGPGGGREGGQVIFNGNPNKLVELKTPSAIALNNFLARHNGVKA